MRGKKIREYFIKFFLLQMEERRTIGGGGKEFASSKIEAFLWQVK
jgi:hypothetical protein